MNLYEITKINLSNKGLQIDRCDLNRPWGGFFVLNENQIIKFAEIFFEDLDLCQSDLEGKLSPKILLVKPKARLSWQYHHRRSEIWRVVEGPVGVIRSATDDQGEPVRCDAGETIVLGQGERHRLIGLDNWGIVAEIWRHVDNDNPSDEGDIVRIQDDYSRK
jgi:mannose-6-phosphate isomerase-like protein (cupin superfamily)